MPGDSDGFSAVLPGGVGVEPDIPALLTPTACGEGESGLPEGITKQIMKSAEPGMWRRPKVGDKCTVQYTGMFASSGETFDSSKDRGPVTFTVGSGEVIKGWDIALPTMCQGEVSQFTLDPVFAYGERGVPPKIPPNAALTFEIELLSWICEDNLFGDWGVVRTTIKEGNGWVEPEPDCEVLCTVLAQTSDGRVLEDRQLIEYVMGSGVLGPISAAVDKAFLGMRKGGAVSLKCSSQYAHEDHVVVDLTLHEIYETTDVSLSKDGSVMKKRITEGDGYDTPEGACRIRLCVEHVRDCTGSDVLDFVGPKDVDFILGEGEVCDALEHAVLAMKQG
eukprot:gnl/TRDRNA2_/TRDRNA2_140975_c0_seq2.p1 gnl/TRDRNA2_/TRDRNA2_140975_c0~~gnl/TRDRNA2_/TRDRNA2_140975_c0_seq2.p1  ORF type:complete len:334 (+),score=73.41 gnl/TRDRNA2_/TRDRNA2_140975_c0_seq2:43-1044(+)